MTLRAALLALALATGAAAAEPAWRSAAPVPLPRTEVAAAAVGGEIAVVGGYLADGSTSRRVDFYDPSAGSWRRGPDLPVAVNHAMAATVRGRLYVVGGYGSAGPLRAAFVLADGRWRALPKPPAARAAAGSAGLGGRLYVAGGVAADGLARTMLVYDPRARKWSTTAGPTRREHLAVAVAGGRLYAVAGRTAGLDTNLSLVESWSPGARAWRAEPPVPEPRGGTGAAGLGNTIVSVGGEAPAGTIGTVYRFSIATRRWSRLADLPTPRHGLGVVALGGAVYAVAGGPQPGLHVSDANELLRLP
jgi:Kelch motif/Galactose oxidase, central domain